MPKITTYILILSFGVFSCKNTYTKKHKVVKQPKKTIFKNIEIDTTKLFGLWSQDPTAPFADFYISAKSFDIVDDTTEGIKPYILDKNKIIVFVKDSIHNGLITCLKKDTLKIKWRNTDVDYIKIED